MRKQAKRCKAQPQQVSLVNCSFQGSGKGVTLVVITADTAAESTIYRKKPTPKLLKAESTN